VPTNLAEFYRGAEAASRAVATTEPKASPAARAALVHVALAPLLAAGERPEPHDAAGPGCEGAAASRACTAGCDACCHFPVGVTFGEALLLAAAVRVDRELAARVATAAGATHERPWSELVGLPCPLLTNGECAVYAARPLPCRALASSDAGACRAALASPTVVPCDEAALFRGLGATNVLAAEHPAGLRELRSAVAALLGQRDPRAGGDAFAAFAAARAAT
jgi:hypothetical protein